MYQLVAARVLLAAGAGEHAARLILLDAALIALHEAARTFLFVPEQEGTASATVDLKREDSRLTLRHVVPP